MKKLLILLPVIIAACTSQVKPENKDIENEMAQVNAATEVSLNNGSKWKADEATKKNVAEMILVVNDSIYTDATKRMQLYASLQIKVDTLVKQCVMQGAEHDALHAWLEKVLDDMKELKEEDDEYSEAYADLKKDVEAFNSLFE